MQRSKTVWSMGFPCGSGVKNPQAIQEPQETQIPWVGNMPWRRAWQPSPVFLLGNPMDRGYWWATVHRVIKNWTQLKRQHTRTYGPHTGKKKKRSRSCLIEDQDVGFNRQKHQRNHYKYIQEQLSYASKIKKSSGNTVWSKVKDV